MKVARLRMSIVTETWLFVELTSLFLESEGSDNMVMGTVTLLMAPLRAVLTSHRK